MNCDVPAVCEVMADAYKKELQGKTLEESGYYDLTEEMREVHDRAVAAHLVQIVGLAGIAGILDPNYKSRFTDNLERNHPSDFSSENRRKYVLAQKMALARSEPLIVTAQGWSEATKHMALYSSLALEKAELESDRADLLFPPAERLQKSDLNSNSTLSHMNFVNAKIRQITELQGLLEQRKDKPQSS